MAEERLEGGYVDGAVRVGDTVRRLAGPWTLAVQALLAYLADKGFTGAPRPLRFAAAGDEASGRLLRQGVPEAVDQALAELASFAR